MEKANFPENLLIYINQPYLTIQKSIKMYYCDYYILGQIIEAMDPPNDIKKYQLKGKEVKYLRPRCNRKTGEFLGVYETIGFVVVRGDPFEVFLNYGYDKDMSKILYSTFRNKIPNCFCGTMFNCHKNLIESNEIGADMSKMLFYLPSITDRSEKINQNFKSVSISQFDINQQQLHDIWADNTTFRPDKLDFVDLETEKMKGVVVKALDHIAGVSNSNLVRNADRLLFRKNTTSEVKWVDGVKRVIPEKYKVSY